jgi:hypothetical protein
MCWSTHNHNELAGGKCLHRKHKKELHEVFLSYHFYIYPHVYILLGPPSPTSALCCLGLIVPVSTDKFEVDVSFKE